MSKIMIETRFQFHEMELIIMLSACKSVRDVHERELELHGNRMSNSDREFVRVSLDAILDVIKKLETILSL